MTHNRQALHEFLEKSFERFRELPSNRVDPACDRVLNRLREEPDHAPRQVLVRSRSTRNLRVILAFAALTAAAVFAQRLATRSSRQESSPPLEVPVNPPSLEATTSLQERTPDPPKAQKPNHPEFAAASIKVVAPKTMMSSMGLACQGTDGMKRVVLTITRDAQTSIKAPQGRCIGSGIFLSSLIEVAYGVQPRQIMGGPEWARTSGSIIGGFVGLPAMWSNKEISWYENESFQIEAIAEDPATATVEQLQQMLQGLLETRFKLKFHRERKELPGYSLVVAERGAKLTPISGDYEESLVFENGRSTIDKLARTLASFLLDTVPVEDKTGLRGAYEYRFSPFPRTPVPRGGGGDSAGGGRGGGAPSITIRAENLSANLEDQLGLRLQPERSIAVDVLVIDSVQPPSPN